MIEMCKEIKDLDNGRYVHRQVHRSSVNENSRIQNLLMVSVTEGRWGGGADS